MRITIVGLGLIGGSLGMALKQARGSELEIVGYARNAGVAERAKQLRAVDRTENTLAASVGGSDLVFICTPVRAVEEVLQGIASHTPPGCLITDTASTKQQVMVWARKYLCPKLAFVGGHPMAGKESFGIEAADSSLFKGCAYCLTPADWTDPKYVEVAKNTVEWTGGKPFLMDARQHDYMVAGISHLPALVSAAVVAATAGSADWPIMAGLASTGYRDTTRLASGNPKVLGDILSTNREAVLHWVDEFSRVLAELKAELARGNGDLEDTLARVRQARQQWLEGRANQQCSQ